MLSEKPGAAIERFKGEIVFVRCRDRESVAELKVKKPEEILRAQNLKVSRSSKEERVKRIVDNYVPQWKYSDRFKPLVVRFLNDPLELPEEGMTDDSSAYLDRA